MPAIVGFFSVDLQLDAAMSLCACSAYFIVVLAAYLQPETRGRDLRSMLVEPAAEHVAAK